MTYRKPDLERSGTARAAKVVTGMLLAGIVHGLRNPDEAAVRELNGAIRRLLIDGVRKD